MIKPLLLFTALLSAVSTFAESFNVVCGNVVYSYDVSKAGDMPYTNGNILSILGKDYNLGEVTSMYVDEKMPEPGTVYVEYASDKATVTVDGMLAAFVNVTVSGAHVSVTQSADVSEATCGEITYSLSGQSSDGSFLITGSYKCTVALCALDLTSTKGAAIDIQNGKRIALRVCDNTANSISDSSAGTQKGSLVCKGHLEFEGSGSLDVNGNTAHAIYAKEYISFNESSLKVLSAVKDGINCNQYMDIKGGEISISGTGDDGIQVSFKDDVDREPQDTGSINITGGIINVTTTAKAAKAIKADGDISITNGKITAKVTGAGQWSEKDSKTKASTCLSADGNMLISGGSLLLEATASGGKGISIDGNLNVTGGDITVATSGGMFAYVNSTEYDNYTGNTDNLASDNKSSPKGIKADGNITIDGGSFNVTTKGNGGEGIESKAVLTINNGLFNLNTYDDAINSSSHMYINGGTITAIATNNDALDSNGNLYIAGGHIMALGAREPEGGIDANEEEGYTVVFTGGTLLATGGRNSTPTTAESTQPFVSTSIAVTGGSTVKLQSGDNVLATFNVPAEYNLGQGGRFAPGGGPGGPGSSSSGGVLITCPGISSGSSYTIISGSSSASATATLKGSSSGGRP